MGGDGLLLRVLAMAAVVGAGAAVACAAATLTWAATGSPGPLREARWLARCAVGCLAAVLLCKMLLRQRRRWLG